MSPSPRTGRHRRALTTAVTLIATSVAAVTAAILASPGGSTAAPIPATDYQQVQLALGSAELGEAMSLAVLPNRSVIHTARNGTVRVTDAAGNTKVAGNDPRLHPRRGGPAGRRGRPGLRHQPLRLAVLLAAADAPRAATRRPPAPRPTSTPWKGHLNLSRFTLNADNTLNMASEKIVLKVANDRGQCCHVGGDIDFDAAGNLYLTTGDDTNPFESSGVLADRRADQPQPAVRRPALLGQHQRPARQAAADQAAAPTAPTPSRPATCSRPARRTPVPRSTRWASATRSG